MAALCCFYAFSGLAAEGARWPAPPGPSLRTDGKLQVDASNSAQGYILAALQKANKHKMKLRVAKDQQTLTYDLNGQGEFEVFPLQLGSGKYEITLYENVSGKNYANAGKITISVEMPDAEACFLYPNQYVHYTIESEAVGKADALCAGKSAKDAYEAVCGFMSGSFVYDYVKAVTIKAGVLPDIDGSYSKKMGVCQDLSAIMCCMLRTQGLPARLMIGYADANYHAWVTVKLDGKEYFFDPTAAVNGIGKVANYSVERYY